MRQDLPSGTAAASASAIWLALATPQNVVRSVHRETGLPQTRHDLVSSDVGRAANLVPKQQDQYGIRR